MSEQIDDQIELPSDPGKMDQLRKLTENIRYSVNKIAGRASSQNSYQTYAAYPTAVATMPANTIGIVLDAQHDVIDLVGANKINPPNDKYWLHITNYADFADFLNKRGIPAYVSFGGVLANNSKQVYDSRDCVKLFIKSCRKAGLKELPQWECHCQVITKKQQIEFELMDY